MSSPMMQCSEFQGLSYESFSQELDRILIISLKKVQLADAFDLRRRVLLYPIFGKIFDYRKQEVKKDTPKRMVAKPLLK
uniref:Uncharacterized protein n=1 Tax=Caenorhabditis japonica TaxID=281687 RepID=A0A8R1IJX2_CAEJA